MSIQRIKQHLYTFKIETATYCDSYEIGV